MDPFFALCRGSWHDAQLNGALANLRHGRGQRTRLMHAAHAGRAARFQRLLRAGARLDARDASGASAADYLLRGHGRGHQRILAHLESLGGEPLLPLLEAVQGGHARVVLQHLQRSPALANTPLHLQTRDPVRPAPLFAAFGALAKGAWQWRPPAALLPDSDRRTHLLLLHWASTQGLVEVVEALLAAGAQPDALHYRSGGGTTALFAAARLGHARVVRALLQGGACPLAPRLRDGATPLLAAARRGNARCASLLLAAALQRAPGFAAGAHAAECLRAAAAGSAPGRAARCVAGLCAGGLDPNAAPRPGDGWTPLHLAVAAGRLDTVEALLGAGAAPAPALPACGRTPLHLAAAAGATGAVRALAAAGAHAGAAAASGATPLMLAAQGGFVCTARELLALGAGAGAVDGAGASALDYARRASQALAAAFVLGALKEASGGGGGAGGGGGGGGR